MTYDRDSDSRFNNEVVDNPRTDGKSMTEPFRAFSFPFIETEKDKEFKPGPNTYAFHLDRVEAEKTNPCLEVPEMDLCPIGREKSVQDQVIMDMIERKKFGLAKYGKEIMPEDSRDMLRETAEELMDALVYLRAESNVRAELNARIAELEDRNLELKELLLTYKEMAAINKMKLDNPIRIG